MIQDEANTAHKIFCAAMSSIIKDRAAMEHDDLSLRYVSQIATTVARLSVVAGRVSTEVIGRRAMEIKMNNAKALADRRSVELAAELSAELKFRRLGGPKP